MVSMVSLYLAMYLYIFEISLLFTTLVDSCTNIGVTNCAHFTNVDDQGNVLCMCRPGYRVDLSNSSNCIGECIV